MRELAAIQESQLQTLTRETERQDYEERAQYEMQSEGSEIDIFEQIDLDSGNDKDSESKDEESDKSMAFADDIVIEN